MSKGGRISMQNKKRKLTGMKIISKLLALIGSLSYVIVIAVFNGSLGHILGIFIPVLGSVAVAKALGAAVSISYAWLFALIITFGILRGILRYFEQYANHYIAFKLLAKMRDIIFQKLRVLCPAKLETKQKGTIISMITADIETIEVFYAHTISPVGIALISSLTMVLFIGFSVNWYMAIFAAFAYLIVAILLPLLSQKTTMEVGQRYRKQFTAFNGYFMDAIKGSKDIILHGKEEEHKENIDLNTDKLLESSTDLKNKGLTMNVITNMVVIILNLCMLSLGLILVKFVNLSAPIMLVGVVALMSSYGPVLALAALPNSLSQTFASGERVFDLLAEEPAVRDIENKNEIEADSVKVENLSFSYGQNPVLDNVSVEVKKGEIVGIMGESGCGKSTLLKLLLRFWKKQKGRILYNGIEIEDLNTSSLKKNVVMVSQSTYLFEDTIKGNLKIAKPSASDEEIIEACKKAGIHDFVSSLKDGYDTKVGGKNAIFSAGESQRLAIARCFLSDAQIILLDEPTSNVDAINEGIILKSLIMNKKDKAIIIVSHRESTMSIADRVYYFNSNGQETLHVA